MKKILLTAFSLLIMASASAAVEGTYTAVKYAGYSVGNSYTFSSGSSWSSEDEAEGEEEEDNSWEVVVAAAEDGGYTVTNLIGWNETLNATYNADNGTLVIAPGASIYYDETYACYTYVCGGIVGYDTPEALMSYCDSQSGWIPQSKTLKSIVLKVEDDNLVLDGVLMTYIDYYPGMGYYGIPSDLYTELTLVKKEGGVNSILNDDAEIEYYNINGIRLQNPQPGQLIIKRQGGNVSKIIIR